MQTELGTIYYLGKLFVDLSFINDRYVWAEVIKRSVSIFQHFGYRPSVNLLFSKISYLFDVLITILFLET